jgi:hypothetical protein
MCGNQKENECEQEVCEFCLYYTIEEKKCDNRDESPIDPDDSCEMIISMRCTTCKQKRGEPRIDNGIKAGVHCDECWNKMLIDCRKRSW